MRIVTRMIDWFATPYSLFLLLRDPLISWNSKVKAGLILAAASVYIIIPFDLIPDFSPFLGLLDDLVIVPAIFFLAGIIVPEVSLAEIRNKARSSTKRIMVWTFAVVVGLFLLSLTMIGLAIYFAVR
jgi:uncharacterized membrane protein YkvA (DUF1232 family)